MKRAELQRSVHAERTFFDRLQQRADKLIATAAASQDAAKVKQLKTVLDHAVNGGKNTLPIEANLFKRIKTVFTKYPSSSATPWNLSANAVQNLSNVFSSSTLSGHARFSLLLGLRSGGAYAVAESDNRQMATGRHGTLEDAALASGISGGAANIATRLYAQRLAGMKVFNFKMRGGDTRISAQYTDTASFQAVQYGINAAASLVANTAWDLADGTLGHLDAMRQDASEEMMRMAAFHQIRHRSR